MRRAVLRLLAFGAVVAAVACVEITSAPGGVVSIRFLKAPRSIIVGDQLRDSTGAVTMLHAVAFNASGDSVKDAAFRFFALALPVDTSAAQQAVPLVVDSLTGAVRTVSGPIVATRARLGVRLGTQLQVLDTIAIVKRPTALARATTGDTVRMAFVCSDTLRASTSLTKLGLAKGDTVNTGNALPLAVALTADSTGGARAAVPSYYVHFQILAPTTIPTVTLASGVRRPALSIIADPQTDRATDTDTTDASGTATAYLRVVAAGLPPASATDTLINVKVRASAITSPTDTVPSPVNFTVQLRRLTQLSGIGKLTGPGCPP